MVRLNVKDSQTVLIRVLEAIQAESADRRVEVRVRAPFDVLQRAAHSALSQHDAHPGD